MLLVFAPEGTKKDARLSLIFVFMCRMIGSFSCLGPLASFYLAKVGSKRAPVEALRDHALSAAVEFWIVEAWGFGLYFVKFRGMLLGYQGVCIVGPWC